MLKCKKKSYLPLDAAADQNIIYHKVCEESQAFTLFTSAIEACSFD